MTGDVEGGNRVRGKKMGAPKVPPVLSSKRLGSVIIIMVVGVVVVVVVVLISDGVAVIANRMDSSVGVSVGGVVIRLSFSAGVPTESGSWSSFA